MYDNFVLPYFEDYHPMDLRPIEFEKSIEIRIQKADSVEELANILSDELAKSILNQLKF